MIRIAEIKDSSNIAVLSIRVWLDTYAKQGIRETISRYVLSEFTQENVGRKLCSKDRVYLVATKDEHLIGFASLNFKARCPVTGFEFPELDKLYVQENFTASGVGSKLLYSTLAYCYSKQYEKLWLTVNHENIRAQKFYAKHEFQETGVTYFEFENEKHKNYILCRPTAV